MVLNNVIRVISFLSIAFYLTINLTAYSQAARPNLAQAAQNTKQRDASVVAVNELSDVEGNEWAYNAVQQLVEKYDVLEGYPDGTYKGKKPTTRFELAAAVYDVASYFSDEIALDRDDLAKLAKLLDEFSGEIKTIQGRVDQLETKVKDVEAKTTELEGKVAEHSTKLEEHEQRLAYAERRKGFILERMLKGVVVDVRDLSRGMFAAVSAPFNKTINGEIGSVSQKGQGNQEIPQEPQVINQEVPQQPQVINQEVPQQPQVINQEIPQVPEPQAINQEIPQIPEPQVINQETPQLPPGETQAINQESPEEFQELQ